MANTPKSAKTQEEKRTLPSRANVSKKDELPTKEMRPDTSSSRSSPETALDSTASSDGLFNHPF